MKRNQFLLMIIFIALLVSCVKQESNPSVICTMEYRTISIHVIGDTLQYFYTIRQSTGDTIRYNNMISVNPFTYSVLEDSYQPNLANKTDSFIFYGVINNSIVVKEPFQIKADQCHIEYLSGKQEIIL